MRESGLAVRRGVEIDAEVVQELPTGATVVCAEVAPSTAGAGSFSVRIAAPAGWVEFDSLEPAPGYEPLALSWEKFDRNHLSRSVGDEYGLEFPFSHAGFQEAGADFLTRAFRAAGTIAADNRVTSIENYQPIDLGGASVSAGFDVTYQESAPGLHSELFVKMPAADPMRKFISSHMLFGETQISKRFSEVGAPVPVAAYYFGDYCRENANGLLITERIAFGTPPIDPVLSKGLDHLVADTDERYAALTDLQARIVTFHKAGGLGPDAEDVFPFRSKTAGMPPVEVEPLIDFTANVVGHLLPSEWRSPASLDVLRRDSQEILDRLDELATFLCRDVDYTGFCHANLNLDNAWFWRTPEGQLKAGLIDWGSSGQMSLGQSFQGMLFCTEPARFLSLRRDLVRRFVERYEAESGVRLDAETLLLHAKVASMTGLPLLVYAIQDVLTHYSEAELRGIDGAADARLSSDSGLGTMLAMLGTFLSEWSDDSTPREICARICDS